MRPIGSPCWISLSAGLLLCCPIAACATQVDEVPVSGYRPSASDGSVDSSSEVPTTAAPAAPAPVSATPMDTPLAAVQPATAGTPGSNATAATPTAASPSAMVSTVPVVEGQAGVPTAPNSGGAPSTPTAPLTGGSGGALQGGNGGTVGVAGVATSGGQGGDTAPTDPIETDGTELLVDDFEDGDAANWLADMADGDDVVGDWQVVMGNGGFVYQQSAAVQDATYTFTGEVAWTDVALSADVAFLTTSDGDASAPVGEDGFIYVLLRRAPRAGSDSDFNYVVVEFRSDGQFRIRRRLDGSSGDPIADWNALGFQAMANQWHHLSVRAEGNLVSLYYNDFEILDGMIPTGLESGQIGFGVVDATVAIDNVVVSQP